MLGLIATSTVRSLLTVGGKEGTKYRELTEVLKQLFHQTVISNFFLHLYYVRCMRILLTAPLAGSSIYIAHWHHTCGVSSTKRLVPTPSIWWRFLPTFAAIYWVAHWRFSRLFHYKQLRVLTSSLKCCLHPTTPMSSHLFVVFAKTNVRCARLRRLTSTLMPLTDDLISFVLQRQKKLTKGRNLAYRKNWNLFLLPCLFPNHSCALLRMI